VENKWSNVKAIAGVEETEIALREAVDEVSAGHFGRAVIALRKPRFFDLLPFLGLLLIGPVAMLVARLRGRRDGPDWRFAVTALGFCALACLVWVLLMFGNEPAMTVIHQGSLAVPLLAVCACAAGACAVDRRLGLGLVLANVAVVLLLYLPALAPPSGSSYSAIAAVLAAAALAAIGRLTLWPPRDRAA
jgi:hypothetical protein